MPDTIPFIYREGWIACLKELGIPTEHPTWSKATPEGEQLDTPQPYYPLVLLDFDEEECLKDPIDNGR